MSAKRYPGTFEDRGAYMRWICYVGGQRHAFRLDSFDKKANEKFAREKYRELQGELVEREKRRAKGIDDAMRFSALLTQYQRDELPTLAAGTQRAYKDSLIVIEEYFVRELSDPLLVRIGTKHVKGYLAWRRTQRRAGKHRTATKEPISGRTLEKDRAVLHRLFDFAFRLELIEGNPVARVERPKSDPRSPVLLSDEQYEKLLEKCADNPQLWLYTLLLGETGGRAISEALTLRWEHVDLAEGFIEIRSEGRRGLRTKSGKSRYVPMTPRLHQALRVHAERTRLVTYHGHRSPWVFHHERDRQRCKAGDRIKTFRTAFDSAQKAAGIPDEFHRHDLRHRRATKWLAEGANPVHVKEALGHSDLRTTMGYTHLSREHLRSLVGQAAAPSNVRTTKKA